MKTMTITGAAVVSVLLGAAICAFALQEHPGEMQARPNDRTRMCGPSRNSSVFRKSSGPGREGRNRTEARFTFNSQNKGRKQTVLSNSSLGGNEATEVCSVRRRRGMRSNAPGKGIAQVAGSQITAPGRSVVGITDIAFPTTGSVDTLGEIIGSGLAFFLSGQKGIPPLSV